MKIKVIAACALTAAVAGISACSSGGGSSVASGSNNCEFGATDAATTDTVPSDGAQIHPGVTVQVWQSGESCDAWETALANFGMSWTPQNMGSPVSPQGGNVVCYLSQNGVVLDVVATTTSQGATTICSTKESQGWVSSSYQTASEKSAESKAAKQAAQQAAQQAQAQDAANVQQAQQDIATAQNYVGDSVSDWSSDLGQIQADLNTPSNVCSVGDGATHLQTDMTSEYDNIIYLLNDQE